MKKTRKLLLGVLAFTLLGTLSVAVNSFDKANAEEESYKSIAGGDFESGIGSFVIGGAKTGAETLAVSREQKHGGENSLKLSGRTTASTVSVSTSDIELGKEYVYKAYILSDVPMWFNLQATFWAEYDNGGLWNVAVGDGILTEAGVWKEVTATYKFYVEDGKFYGVVDGKTAVLAQNFAQSEPRDTTFRNFNKVDFEINALDSLDAFYVDDVIIYDKLCPKGITAMNVNSDMEKGATSGYLVNAYEEGKTGNLVYSEEKAYSGVGSIKFTRTGNTQMVSIVTGVELNKTYRFSFWLNSTVSTWANPVVSPSAKNVAGNNMWGDLSGGSFLCVGGRWTKIYMDVTLSERDGKLVASDGTLETEIKNHADAEDTSAFASISEVVFKFNALESATEFYVDDFAVYDVANPYVEPIPPEYDDSGLYNYFTNGDMEYGISEYMTYSALGDNKITIAHEEQQVHSGDYSMKITGRTDDGDQVVRTLAASNIVLDKLYTLSAYVYVNETTWTNFLVSPWGTGNETNGLIWTDLSTGSTLVEAGTWTKMSGKIKFGIEDNKLYVDNGMVRNYAKNHAGTGDVTCKAFQNVQFKFAALKNATVIYLDDMRLTYEEDERVALTAPTGHGDNNNTEDILGQMFSNASFEDDMFLKTGSPNGGIWFWDLPAGIRSNKEYSHSGTRCVEVYNRQTATGEFRVNLNTIRINREYTYTIYLSSLAEVDAAASVTMFGYEDKNGVHRDPFVYAVSDYKTINGHGWTKFEITFHYEEEKVGNTTNLVLYFGDEKMGVAESCTGLSCFVFGFKTQETDVNCLTNIYLDSADLKDVTKTQSGTENGDGESGGTVIDSSSADPDKADGETKRNGCGSVIAVDFSLVATVLIVNAVILVKKRRKQQ